MKVRSVCLRMMLIIQRFCVILSLYRFASVDVTTSASAKDRSEILHPALHRFNPSGQRHKGNVVCKRRGSHRFGHNARLGFDFGQIKARHMASMDIFLHHIFNYTFCKSATVFENLRHANEQRVRRKRRGMISVD